MKGIILKDLISIFKGYKSYLYIMLMCLIISIIIRMPYYYMGMIALIFMLMPYSVALSDIKNSCALYCDCMPVKREDYIKAKYVEIIFACASFIVLVLVFYFPMVVIDRHLNLRNYMLISFIMAAMFLLNACFVLPVSLYVKLPAAQYLGAGISGIFASASIAVLLSVINTAKAINIYIFALCLLALSLALFISYKLSCKAYLKKEL